MNKLSEMSRPYLLLVPFFVLMALFVIGLVACVYTALGYMPSFNMTELTFEYFERAFQDPATVESIWLSCYIALVSSLLAIIGGVLLSWCLVTVCKGRGVLNAIARFPILVPSAVASLFVIQVFSSTGILSRVFESVGLVGVAALFDSILYMPNSFGIILSYCWKEIPFCCYMVITTMAGISDSLGEAATSLGASNWRSFRKVVLPQCLPAARNAFIIILAVTFGFYEVPFLLGSTSVRALPVLVYNEYKDPNFVAHRPYAMAICVIMVVISALIAAAVYVLCEVYFKKKGLSIHGKH